MVNVEYLIDHFLHGLHVKRKHFGHTELNRICHLKSISPVSFYFFSMHLVENTNYNAFIIFLLDITFLEYG